MTKSIALNSTIAVLAALAMVFAYATPAFAAMNSSSITITTTNRGTINNYTSAKSHTGENKALGSVGGRGGDGGEVDSDGDNNNGGATSGNGGNGGNGGPGGLVNTGDASADAGTVNLLNDTNVEVAVPTDMNSSSVVLETDNDQNADCECNVIDNDTRARARSGENTAEGSVGGNADDGGDIEGGDGNFNNGGATSGTGGAGGSGGVGGTVFTGNARSDAGTINWLNTTIIRVRN